MSTLRVPVAHIEKLRPHPNADTLQIAEVLGWQVVTGTGDLKEGDLVVYFPPDTVLPEDVSDAMGVTKYLSKGRVRQVKLRGEPSFGFVHKPEADDPVNGEAMIGENVAEWYRATKYEPPVRHTAGDAEVDDARFVRYTEIENLRHYPDIIQPGEQVVITEKIHGTNARIGYIDGTVMAGSKELRRQRPRDSEMAANIYWMPYTIPGMEALLHIGNKQIIVYGEVYGKVQNLHYDKPGTLGFRAFNIMVDGKYLNYLDFKELMEIYEIPRVPVLYEGPFSKEVLKRVTKGNSVLNPEQIKEGVVVQPMVERTDPVVGRVILKYLSEDYLFSKGVTDFKDV